MNIQCSGDSRDFAKEVKVLKVRSVEVGHWKLTMNSWEDVKTDPLTTMQEVAEELNIYHSTVLRHLKQIRKFNK